MSAQALLAYKPLSPEETGQFLDKLQILVVTGSPVLDQINSLTEREFEKLQAFVSQIAYGFFQETQWQRHAFFGETLFHRFNSRWKVTITNECRLRALKAQPVFANRCDDDLLRLFDEKKGGFQSFHYETDALTRDLVYKAMETIIFDEIGSGRFANASFKMNGNNKDIVLFPKETMASIMQAYITTQLWKSMYRPPCIEKALKAQPIYSQITDGTITECVADDPELQKFHNTTPEAIRNAVYQSLIDRVKEEMRKSEMLRNFYEKHAGKPVVSMEFWAGGLRVPRLDIEYTGQPHGAISQDILYFDMHNYIHELRGRCLSAPKSAPEQKHNETKK